MVDNLDDGPDLDEVGGLKLFTLRGILTFFAIGSWTTLVISLQQSVAHLRQYLLRHRPVRCQRVQIEVTQTEQLKQSLSAPQYTEQFAGTTPMTPRTHSSYHFLSFLASARSLTLWYYYTWLLRITQRLPETPTNTGRWLTYHAKHDLRFSQHSSVFLVFS